MTSGNRPVGAQQALRNTFAAESEKKLPKMGEEQESKELIKMGEEQAPKGLAKMGESSKEMERQKGMGTRFDETM